jgi:hypothetical protein
VPTVVCPLCGEDDDLTGTRSGERIELTCGACATRWDRDVTLVTTPSVGPHLPPGASRDLRALRRPDG